MVKLVGSVCDLVRYCKEKVCIDGLQINLTGALIEDIYFNAVLSLQWTVWENTFWNMSASVKL